MRIFDSHQHFWRIGGPGQTWPDSDWPLLYRDFLPDDLRDAADGLELVGTVLVQSQPDDGDTDWMFDCAGGDPLVKAIVGWADLERPDAAERIAELAGRPRLRGLRPMLQSIEETEWILRPSLDPAIEAMVAHGLAFDALIQPRHLPAIRAFAERWPELRIVIDHAAKPHAGRGELDPWRDDIAFAAERPNIFCKLSGLRTEQAPGQPADDLAPYVDHLIAHFPDRLMWGSDWPVLLHAGDSYRDWLVSTLRLAGALAPSEASALFEGTARRFYGIEEN